jgi:hypothetical protein
VGTAGAAGYWSAAEDSFAEDVNELVEVAETGGGEALVGLADEEVDVLFVLDDEGLNVGVVEEFGALGLGEDEVGEEEEADPGVEGEPADDEDGP